MRTFWQQHQYARLDNADLPVPRELDPFERLWVRWIFAEGKVLLLVPVGVAVGWCIEWLAGGRFIP